MNHDLNDELKELYSKLSILPSGYISKKIISGKTYHYLQWNENGKKKSKYISESIIPSIQKQLEERKIILSRIREIELLLDSKSDLNVPNGYSKTSILLGDELSSFISNASQYKKRYCFSQLTAYLYGKNNDKVFILYGLRRTGKTTLIKQAILEMNDGHFAKTAFIQIQASDSLANLNYDLKHLQANGYKFVFIDEITLLKDFIDGAALLSDIFASCGMKIVLSGTDSLGFLFSRSEQLYDRCILLHTTFIPYREFEEVLGVKGIDEYIRYGGTMSLSGIDYNSNSTFSNEDNMNNYVDSAIARNIQHSLEYYQHAGHFRSLYDLYERDELTSAINRVIEDYNHAFTIEVLTRDFISNDLEISANNLRHDRTKPNDILDKVDKPFIVKNIMKLLDVKNKDNQTIEISDSHRVQIKEYLDLLDLTKDVEKRYIPVSDIGYRTIFTQPGMRYCQAEALVKSLLLDKAFASLSIDERKAVNERILSEIKGRMMEDIVLLETMLSNKYSDVFKLQFAIGEYDMVTTDEKSSTCMIYEIKHSSVAIPEQYRYLIDKEKEKATEFRYGKIVERIVIYRGATHSEGDIDYINVEEYLKSL